MIRVKYKTVDDNIHTVDQVFTTVEEALDKMSEMAKDNNITDIWMDAS
jgi:hypothetical protein